MFSGLPVSFGLFEVAADWSCVVDDVEAGNQPVLCQLRDVDVVDEADVPSASTQVKSNQNATASPSSRKTRRSVSLNSAVSANSVG
jgi:hypothetical protein